MIQLTSSYEPNYLEDNKNTFCFIFSVRAAKRKWKSLRDNFRVELKKVPNGKSWNSRLPVDQYLSKWPYFKMLFFLRDSMTREKFSGNLNATMTVGESEPKTSSCASPPLSCQSTPEISEFSSVDSGTSHPSRIRRKRIRDCMENDTEQHICIEKEKVQIEKQRLHLLIKDNEKREREENNSDRLFLLSMLPSLNKIPERDKSSVKIKFQRILHETIYGSTDDSNI